MLEYSYLAIPDGKIISIFDSIGSSVGKIERPSIWSNKAIALLSDNFSLVLKPTGLMGLDFEVRLQEGETIFAYCNTNWRLITEIIFFFSNEPTVFKLKRISFFLSDIKIVDSNDVTILTLKSKWVWKSFKNHYHINVNEGFYDIEYRDIFLFVALYRIHLNIQSSKKSAAS
jgi:hypothetical protein